MPFSKVDEQASVRPSKWKRWSPARRAKHLGRMTLWDHGHNVGEGRVQVQVGTGQVEASKNGSAVQPQVTSETSANKEVRQHA